MLLDNKSNIAVFYQLNIMCGQWRRIRYKTYTKYLVYIKNKITLTRVSERINSPPKQCELTPIVCYTRSSEPPTTKLVCGLYQTYARLVTLVLSTERCEVKCYFFYFLFYLVFFWIITESFQCGDYRHLKMWLEFHLAK